MHIFDRNGKINFIDNNNVIVGFDFKGQCCERFEWAFVVEYSQDIEPHSMVDESKSILDFERYVFDTENKGIEFTSGKFEDGGAVVFELYLPVWVKGKGYVKSETKAFLILVNAHNGYYSHGFTMHHSNLFQDGAL